MKGIKTLAVLVGLATIAIPASDASAYYHPRLGRFMQRDPGPGGPMRLGAGGPAASSRFAQRDPVGQYADGMNLYQYVKSNPAGYTDPEGLRIKEFRGCTDEQKRLLNKAEEVVKRGLFTLQALPSMKPGAFAIQLLQAGEEPEDVKDRAAWQQMSDAEKKKRLELYEAWVSHVGRQAAKIEAWVDKGWIADCCGKASRIKDPRAKAYVIHAIPDTIFFIEGRFVKEIGYHRDPGPAGGALPGLAGTIAHEASHLTIKSHDRNLRGLLANNIPQTVDDAYWWTMIVEEGYHVEMGASPFGLYSDLFGRQLGIPVGRIPSPPAQ